MPIELTIEEETPISLGIDTESEIGMQADSVVEVTTSDYEKLTNLPKLNGTTIKGNMSESDPTVPSWAKDTEPQEVTTTHIEYVWASIFK